MLRRTLSLTRKEFIHVSRDPRTLAIMFVMPIIMLILLGYAATTNVDHLRTAVYDADKTPQSRDLIAAYQASNYFDIVVYANSEEELRYLIDHNDVRGALVIPPGYGRDMAAQKRTGVAFLVDGSDPSVARTVYGASQQVGQAVSRRLLEQQLDLMGPLPGVDVRPRVWYNPDMESSHFMIPATIVMILFLFTTLFTSTSIVRERELGTIEQLIVTPIRSIELIVAKVLPYILVSFFVIVEVLTLGVLIFGMPVNGSVPLLLGLCSLFLVTALGMGIFISSTARTQVEAFMMTFATIMPTIFLSGFIFPIDAMPRVLQLLSYIFPARYGLIIVRSILLKGVGLEILAEQVAAILVFTVIVVVLASTRFKKKLG